ncbi:MAG: hypothetical protein SXQ77_09000 [Halobacteria archaeon]|nr:hypothetical protein [Halobacteria archaeon]
MRIRDLLGISGTTQARLSRGMQVVLLGILVFGAYRRSIGTVVNAAIAVGVTFLPAVLERDYEIPMDAGLTLWITSAVFLHAVGALGPYRTVWWWDHVTHTLSATLVGAIGYSTVRAFDIHSKKIQIPPRFMFVFILLFVVAFGVVWEVLEFSLGILTESFGSGKVLTQYGLEDTMMDLVFDTIGGVIVAVWGTAYLTNVVAGITEHLRRWEDEN